MSNATRGKKRHCKSCGAKFYDLGREPTACVVCGKPLAGEKVAKPAPPVEKEVKEVKEEVVEAAPIPTPTPTPTPAADEPEFISLDEVGAAEAAGDDDTDIEDEEVIAVLGDVDEDIPDDDNDDTFLEEEDEEGEPDVKGIIGAPIEPKE